ncbi:hypothetical protein EDM68_00775 [Candidatus Uhrbacteria bacterium]|nr:MAG: hypothetical protein EDM68_00775 [Candidatus Uhrbacteria bacterium]
MERPSSATEKPPTEPPKEKRIFDWNDYGIKHPDRISLADLREIFEWHPERIEETKKVFSMTLKEAFGHDAVGGTDRVMPAQQGPWRIMSLRRFSRDPGVRMRLAGAHEPLTDRRFAIANIAPFKEYPNRYVAFAYSTDRDIARTGNEWIRPEDVRFHGMYLAAASIKNPIFLPLAEAEHAPDLSLEIDPAVVEEALRQINVKDRTDCRSALEDVERFGAALALDPEHVRKLKEAIQGFAAYVKPEPKTPHERFCEVGSCFTVPWMFRNYARIMHGLDVETDEYHKEYFGHSQFYHQVNILDKILIVDWTAKQYVKFEEEHYPFVYPIGDTRISKSWGPLARTQKEEYFQLKKQERDEEMGL